MIIINKNSKMTVSNKDFYFLTNNSTYMRYFVDNRTKLQPKRYLFYPVKYETMSASSIQSYEYSLVRKFLWWGIRNKQKMNKYDYEVVRSRWIDLGVTIVGSFVLARFIRIFLFKTQFIGIQNFLQNRNMDARFWKAFTSIAIASYLGIKQSIGIYKQKFLSDLAIQYSSNFVPQNQLSMTQIQSLLDTFNKIRFPWIYDKTQPQKSS